VTTDFARGVEAACFAMQTHEAIDVVAAKWGGNGDAMVALAEHVMQTVVPRPAPDLAGVSEADVERHYQTFRAIYRRDDLESRQRKGIRAVVAAVRTEASPPVDLSALRRPVPPQGYDELLGSLSALDRREMWAAGACDELRVVVSRLRIFMSSCDLAGWPRDPTPAEAVGAARLPAYEGGPLHAPTSPGAAWTAKDPNQ
jgi:hypothetical protein